MKIGIIEYFDAAHSIPGHKKCGETHGHTYQVEVVIEGEPKDGMVLDFSDFKKSVKEVLSTLDHKNLDDILDVATVENIVKFVYDSLKKKLPVISVKIWEGNGKYAEIEGQ